MSGRYFAGIPLKLSAELPEGKAVDYWLVVKADGNESRVFQDEISIDFDGNIDVKLHTKDAPAVILPERTTATTGIYVNEVMPRNVGALADETGHYPAWVEFYNDNSTPIDMAGLYVMNEKYQYQIPGGNSELTTIPAKGHLVFFLDGKPELGALHLGLTLKEEKKNAVYLGEMIDGTPNYIDYYEAPELKKNQSYGRSSDGAETLVTFVNSTPFDRNSNGEVLKEQALYTYVAEVPEPDDPEPDPDDPTPVSEITKTSTSASVNVYPNPTTDFVTIDSDTESVRYVLYTLSGKQLLTGAGKEVDMSGLSSGIYILRVYAGDILQSVKVMKR